MAREDGWRSASDLAEYAYCPRAYWYHEHPPARGPTAASQRRARDGSGFHARVLGAERGRDVHGGAYWIALLAGAALVLGGLWWIFHP